MQQEHEKQELLIGRRVITKQLTGVLIVIPGRPKKRRERKQKIQQCDINHTANVNFSYQ